MEPIDRDPSPARARHTMGATLAALVVLLLANFATAGVPIRLSVKFMEDTAGNFPTMGAITSETDLRAQVEESNRLFKQNGSEFEIEIVEIVWLEEQNAFTMRSLIDHDGDPSTPEQLEPLADVRDRIRNAARNDAARFAWRDDAVNVFVTQNGSGVADFPPNNDIFLVGQGARFTTTAHEVGHIVDLLHTHETATSNNDRCGDTIMDVSTWTRDDIATNAYGDVYADLDDAAKERAVDDVWFNVMSYHPTRERLTGCQLDRGSDGAYRTRDQILDASVRYVDANDTSSPYLGTWEHPYRSLSQVNQSPTGVDAYWVLLAGDHDFAGTLDVPVAEIVTRRGASTIREDIPRWSEEPDLSRSRNPAIVAGIPRVRAADRADDAATALAELRTMATGASDDERIVVELEIAQRLGHLGEADEAIALYRAIRERTSDPYLQAETESQIRHLERKLEPADRSASSRQGSRLDDTDRPAGPDDDARTRHDPAEGSHRPTPTTASSELHRSGSGAHDVEPTVFALRGAEATPSRPAGIDRRRAAGSQAIDRHSAPTTTEGGPGASTLVLCGALVLTGTVAAHRLWRRRRR